VDMTQLSLLSDYWSPTVGLLPTGHHIYGPYLNTTRYKIHERFEVEVGGVRTNTIDTTVVPQLSGSTGNVGQGTRMGCAFRKQLALNYGNTVISASAGGPTPTGVGDQNSLMMVNYQDIPIERKKFLLIFDNNETADYEYPSLEMSWMVSGYTM